MDVLRLAQWWLFMSGRVLQSAVRQAAIPAAVSIGVVAVRGALRFSQQRG